MSRQVYPRGRRWPRPYSILFYSILFSLFVSCDGIGASVNSSGGLYGGTNGDSGSGSTAALGSTGSGGNSFTVEDLLSLSNAGNTEALIELLSCSGGNEAGSTFMVVFSAADIGLPAGGSVTLSIAGSGYSYYGVAQDAGDGSVSFAVPRIAAEITVTVTLTVKASDGSIAATGTTTRRVPEGGCEFNVAMTDTASVPAPDPVPAGFVLVEGNGTVGDLYVCEHEVTQGEYETYCGYGGTAPSATYGVGSVFPAYYVSWYDAILYCNMRSRAEGLTPCYRIFGDQILLPVTSGATYGSGGKPCGPGSANPNWNGVSCDFDANGYRLPTEAEWEYAASDGHECSGADTANVGDVAWYSGNSGTGGGPSSSGGKPHQVKTKDPNAKGIYDMSGNVWEWCWDIYSSTLRVIRGGSWNRDASLCAVSFRDYGTPDYRYSHGGFRVVRNAP